MTDRFLPSRPPSSGPPPLLPRRPSVRPVLEKPSTPLVLELRGVTVANDAGVSLLEDVDLDVAEGEAIAIVGRNGSGKSTMLRLVAGLVDPPVGSVRLFGKDRRLLGYHERQAQLTQVGFVFDRLGTWDNRTVLGNITLPMEYHHPERRRELAQQARDLAEKLAISHCLHKRISEVDESVRKRVLFARALFMNPKLLLADEPQAPLTPDEARLAKRVIEERRRDRKMAVIYVDHDGDVAPYPVDRYVFVDRGELTLHSGPPAELKLRLSEFPTLF